MWDPVPGERIGVYDASGDVSRGLTLGSAEDTVYVALDNGRVWPVKREHSFPARAAGRVVDIYGFKERA